MLLERVPKAIADILGACLTNLSESVCSECLCSKVKVRGKMVRKAGSVLGEAKEILTLVEKAKATCSLPEKKEGIDDWKGTRTMPA